MIKFNNEQLKLLAGFSSNTGLIFAVGVITPLFSQVDTITVFDVILGLVGVIVSLLVSMWLLRR